MVLSLYSTADEAAEEDLYLVLCVVMRPKLITQRPPSPRRKTEGSPSSPSGRPCQSSRSGPQ